jgi:hypothetical protein
MATAEKEMTCPKGYVEVVATSKGFYGVGKMGSRIQEGETFFVRIGTPQGGWFQLVDEEKDAGKLAPSKKGEKLARKQASIAASRLAKDPIAMFQTMREQMAASAPAPVPAGKVLEQKTTRTGQ